MRGREMSDDEHEIAARHDDPAFVAAMSVGQFTAGVMGMVSKYAAEGTLADLVTSSPPVVSSWSCTAPASST
jgi:hypothetical protein